MSTLGSPVGGGHGAGDDAVLPGPVAVIAGGLSHERDVSLASGRNLVRELRAVGVEAAAYDFDRQLLHQLAMVLLLQLLVATVRPGVPG